MPSSRKVTRMREEQSASTQYLFGDKHDRRCRRYEIMASMDHDRHENVSDMRDEIVAALYAVYGIPIRGYTRFGSGFRRAHN
jgi:hypothetical protein